MSMVASSWAKLSTRLASVRREGRSLISLGTAMVMSNCLRMAMASDMVLIESPPISVNPWSGRIIPA